ncbi:MAG: hypothetical protein ACTHLE_08625 [Agriterribacter sp.]
MCIDIGCKAVASENPLQQRLIFPGRPEIVMVSQREEHLVMQVPDTNFHTTGQYLYKIPWHICLTISL